MDTRLKKLRDLDAGSSSVPTSLCGLNPVRNQAKQLLHGSSDSARLCSSADESEILDSTLRAGKSCRSLTSHDDTNTQSPRNKSIMRLRLTVMTKHDSGQSSKPLV